MRRVKILKSKVEANLEIRSGIPLEYFAGKYAEIRGVLVGMKNSV